MRIEWNRPVHGLRDPMFRIRPLRWLLLPVALSACGAPQDAAMDTARNSMRAQPQIPPVPVAHPAPLYDAEIAQYLQVMREAAQRIQHPTPDERKMLARADAISNAANSGDPAAAANDGELLERALAFRMQTDLAVARLHHLDTAHYQALSERIEDESGELYCDGNARVPDPLLKPHVAEVERLVAIVRNPGPAGSPPIPPACADGGAR